MLQRLKRLLLVLFSKIVPTDIVDRRYPVSIKGIVIIEDKVVLLKNVRDEWELPGGKLDPDETPELCMQREVQEELGIAVKTGKLIHVWMYHIDRKVHVLMVIYGCEHDYRVLPEMEVSFEHSEIGYFTQDQLEKIEMPEGYRIAISKYWNELKNEKLN